MYLDIAKALYFAIKEGVPRKYRVEKEKSQCLLPGCNNFTDHNGGYCCVEHCKEHRRMK